MPLRVLKASVVRNKRVLIRCDFNVPLGKKEGRKKKEEKYVVADDTKLKRSLKTIQFCLDHGAKQVILMSHLGRPEGKVDSKLSLRPVAEALTKLLDQKVELVDKYLISNIQSPISLLENLRFHAGEKKNDSQFAKQLAKLADVYVNEAFASSHRTHASVVGVAKLLPSHAGFSLVEETQQLQQLLDKPKHPFVVVVGGAKISDKLSAIEHLSQIADCVLVGGAIANNFLKAEHIQVYKSYLEDSPADLRKEGVDYVQLADKLLDENKQESFVLSGIPLPKILYPIDVVTGSNPQATHSQQISLLETRTYHLSSNRMYLDIGPQTIRLYEQVLAQAKTVFWNGPMGVFENPVFAKGSKAIATAIAKNSGHTVIGGGETIKTSDSFQLTKKYSYVSAAGGAALEFLSGKTLPGLTPLYA